MISLEKNFIHPFATPNAKYLYDVNTNSIVKIPESIYQYIIDPENNILDDVDINLIEAMTNDGFLKPNVIERIEHPATKHLESIFKTKIQGITLQITQQCNLRCKYCAYSGDYHNRTHSPKVMSLETAKKGVDFIIQRSSAFADTCIGFYGGEPLLSFEAIKDIVAYAIQRGEGKIIRFYMTTNGTLFNKEILDFLDAHDFLLLISLDGPKEMHDKNRVFAASGQGSFDRIMANIDTIKKSYPKLYKRMAFNAVLDPSLDIGCANEFFLACEALDGALIQSSIISSDYKKEQIEIPESYTINDEIEMFKMYLNRLGRLDERHISSVTKQKFMSIHTSMFTLRKPSASMPKVCHPSGPCVPGARKLFMNVDGKLYPCEKISEQSVNTCIGHIDTGLNLEQVAKLLNIGNLTEDVCKKCWGFRLCLLCFIVADDINGLSAKRKLASCQGALNTNEHFLKEYCTLLEYGFRFQDDEIPLFVYNKEETFK
jgi:uncharacterized protein